MVFHCQGLDVAVTLREKKHVLFLGHILVRALFNSTAARGDMFRLALRLAPMSLVAHPRPQTHNPRLFCRRLLANGKSSFVISPLTHTVNVSSCDHDNAIVGI